MQTNSTLLGLSSLDLSDNFNSYAILLYHRMPGIKEVSSMGWHTDSKYSKEGVFLINANCQKENTPTVIITIGHNRILKWRKIIYDEHNKRKPSPNIIQMLLEEGTIMILHPHDECPHIDNESGEKIKYEHGNVNIGKDNCSVAFVFRVLCKKYQFD